MARYLNELNDASSFNNSDYFIVQQSGVDKKATYQSIRDDISNGLGGKGDESVTLTNYDNSSEPAVAVGSWLEVNGTIFTSLSQYSISGSAVAGLNYIKFVVSESSCTPTWTTIPPTWSNAKQGWYSGNDRYLFTLDYDGVSVYSNKVKLLSEQWPEFLKPAFMARQTRDLELDGAAVTQRVIYCRNLHVTANTTLKARTVWVDGDLTIDAGVTLTIEGLEYNPYTTDLSTDYQFDADKPGGLTGTFRTSGAPGFRGGKASNGGSGGPGGGGFGVGGSEGGGVSGGHSNGISIANGGNSNGNGGGGGATCAGGGGVGEASTPSGDSGKGGEVIFFIVKGNFVNNGTITNNGKVGQTFTYYGSGGGGAGIIVVFAFGDAYTGGTINAVGGNGGANGASGSAGSGGGGGGGFIAEVAKTSSFATKSVAGGSGGSGGPGSAGSTGITEEYDISDGTTENIFGSADGDADAILPKIMHLIEGVY